MLVVELRTRFFLKHREKGREKQRANKQREWRQDEAGEIWHDGFVTV